MISSFQLTRSTELRLTHQIHTDKTCLDVITSFCTRKLQPMIVSVRQLIASESRIIEFLS
jgi:hypothetical protein